MSSVNRQSGDEFWHCAESELVSLEAFQLDQSVETVQALLLMTFYASASDKLDKIFTYFGRLIDCVVC